MNRPTVVPNTPHDPDTWFRIGQLIELAGHTGNHWHRLDDKTWPQADLARMLADAACQDCYDTGRRASDGQPCQSCAVANRNPAFETQE